MAEKAFEITYEDYTIEQLTYYLKFLSLEKGDATTKRECFEILQDFDQSVDTKFSKSLVSICAKTAWISNTRGYGDTEARAQEEVVRAVRLADRTILKLCGVCDEKLSHKNFPVRAITAGCRHPVNICLECLRRHIRAQIDANPFDQLQCSSCESVLTEDDVKTWADQELFVFYCQQAYLQYLRLQPDFFLCASSTCGSGQLHVPIEGEWANVMSCHVCKLKTCVRHKTIWHEGRSCDEQDGINFVEARATGPHAEDDKLTEAYLRTKTRICAMCKTVLWKEIGCDYIACSRPSCPYKFCWVCLLPWHEVKHGHYHGQP